MNMTTVINVRPQQNTNKNTREHVIVRLIDPSMSIERQCDERKSGLIRISSKKQLSRAEKKLRKHFKYWMPSLSELNEQQPAGITYKEFDNITGCLQYIKSCGNKCVILELSYYYAQNKEVVSTFQKLPEILFHYCCMPELSFEELQHRWSGGSQSFDRDILPRRVIETQIKDIDLDNQLLLAQIFLTELIVNLPRTDEAKEDLIAFAHYTYENHSTYPTYKEKIEDFSRTYNERDAIKWYTKPDSFISHLVSKTCATFDIKALFKIRLILRDIYVQLQNLHEEQVKDRLKQDITVYRGKMMLKNELSCLKTEGILFTTRNYLSASMKKDVALYFAGDGAIAPNEVSVLISMKIDSTEMHDKPIAFIGDQSFVETEDEVMLSMGLMFRIDSVEDVHNESKHLVKIKMVRGEDERHIEKNLSRFHLLAQTGASCAALGMIGFLASTSNGHQVGEYSKLMSHALESSNTEVAEKLLTISNRHFQPISGPNNIVNSEINIAVNMPYDTAPDVLQSNMEAQHDLGINPTKNLVTDGTTKGHHIGFFAKAIGSLHTPRVRLIAMLVSVVIIVSAVVTPLAIILPLKTQPTTACPYIACSTNTSVQNPSSNYQVEQLDLSCSQSFYNMSIIQVVQRTLNETSAQQYQTFWNYSTNMTYIETPTQLIYYWYSLPGMVIAEESFPNFIEAQFYYTPGSIRNSSNDTWQIWLQNVCGQTAYLSGFY